MGSCSQLCSTFRVNCGIVVNYLSKKNWPAFIRQRPLFPIQKTSLARSSTNTFSRGRFQLGTYKRSAIPHPIASVHTAKQDCLEKYFTSVRCNISIGIGVNVKTASVRQKKLHRRCDIFGLRHLCCYKVRCSGVRRRYNVHYEAATEGVKADQSTSFCASYI